MTTVQPRTSTTTATTGAGTTRVLLACGAAAAPLFAIASLTQAATRAGFDLIRHPLSILSTGDLGWIQIATFLLTGALTIAGALGLRRALHGTPGGRWTPRLLLVHGVGVAASGVFSMDPGDGFPAGTPLGAPTAMSGHALGHMVCGSLAFAALAGACFVFGHHFSRTGRVGVAAASRSAGIALVVGDGWAMSGGYAGSLTMCVGVLAAMLWVSGVAAYLRSRA